MGTKLLIWDMDGTISQGIGYIKEAMTTAFKQEFGIDNAFEKITLSGKPDRLIFYEACDAWGVSRGEVERFFDSYCSELKKIIDSTDTLKVVPYISEVLETLSRLDVVNVLGTGNVEELAWYKLKKLGLEKYFKTGGFGGDEEERYKLIQNAIKNANVLYKKEFKEEDIFVIGDTPRDIECAKKAGVRSIAVATGKFSVEELKKYEPDIAFENLSDVNALIKSVGLN